jgi:hypothetical protein
MVLRIVKVKVNPSIIYSHAESMKKTNAKYPFVKTECKMLRLPAGEISMCWDNVFQSHSPRKLVVAFVNFYSVGSQFPTNPFNFQGYDLKHITVFVDGHPVGGNPIKMNFDDSGGQSVTEALLSLYQVTNKWMNDAGSQISRDDIAKGGYVLYAFDVEPAFAQGDYLTLSRQGNIRIEDNFGKPLPHSVTCIVYSEDSGYIEINLARDIILE